MLEYAASGLAAAGLLGCVCGSTLRILLEFLLPKDGSLVAFGSYALQYGRAVAGLPTFMEVTPAGNSNLLWNPDKDTCQQGEEPQAVQQPRVDRGQAWLEEAGASVH